MHSQKSDTSEKLCCLFEGVAIGIAVVSGKVAIVYKISLSRLTNNTKKSSANSGTKKFIHTNCL